MGDSKAERNHSGITRGNKMEVQMAAIEMPGTIDEHNQLKLDGLLPFPVQNE